jgi:hypothetical protein
MILFLPIGFHDYRSETQAESTLPIGNAVLQSCACGLRTPVRLSPLGSPAKKLFVFSARARPVRIGAAAQENAPNRRKIENIKI